MFDVGQKVVCVDDKFSAFILEIYQQLPHAGRVYRVRDIVRGLDLTNGGETCAVLLDECVNLPNRHGIEHGFAANRFRELEPEKEKVSATQQQTFTFTSGQPVHINCRCVITEP